jgi:phosphoserine aminotransferase
MPTYNFSSGPAMWPRPVLHQIGAELLDFQGTGVSIIELSHRTSAFGEVMDTAVRLFRELTGLPEHYHVLFVHGGARMQFSAVPLNLIGRSPRRLSCHVETDYFSLRAREEAGRYGPTEVLASSAGTGFDRIPPVNHEACPPDAAYVHITSNNTVYGTRWAEMPVGFPVPVVADATSDLMSRQLDLARCGIVYAGFQKNLGPSSLALVVVREDLLGHALSETPHLLDYGVYARTGSLSNTPNIFAIYVMSLMMRWIADQGGLAAVEVLNTTKAGLLYSALDRSSLYVPTALHDHRSMANVTFRLRDESLVPAFLARSEDQGLLALRGHFSAGGLRASLYNGMPLEGVEALVGFMEEFERCGG